MSALAAAIDTTALWETVVASVIAGVGITAIFSFAILGVARLAELGREGRTAASLLWGGLAAVAGLAFAVAIVVGIVVMTQK